jgi:glycosyltransferase involved in cell wall biosynthesis
VKNNISESFNRNKCCVIVPTYNNDGTLSSVIEDISEYTDNIIVVNDGSTDTTHDILKKFPKITCIEFQKNQGKGFALREGFKKAFDLGYEYAISIDSDGQHQASDLPVFLKSLEENPGTLYVGARNMTQEGIPGKSSFGHKFSNFWYRVETGIKLPDTQSGYRLYPIKQLLKMKFYTRKFEFEIEVLVRAAWKGIPVKSVPVQVYYAPAEERISHFRPFTDFFRISVLNTIFVLLAFLYFLPVMYFRNFSYQKFKKLIGAGEPTSKLATAVGFGVFMGIIPIWGYQMIVAAFLAHLFKLNKALVLVASNISIPPMMPFILYGSFLFGKLFVASPVNIKLDGNLSLENIKTAAIQYVAGSIALAIAAGILFGLISYLFLLIRRNRKKI